MLEYKRKPFIFSPDAPIETIRINMNNTEDDSDSEIIAPFLVNRHGIPLDDTTWERMWEYAARNHTGGQKMVTNILLTKQLEPVMIPQAPVKVSQSVAVPQRINMIQDYMNCLQYNHTGTQLFEIKKCRPLSGLMEVAKDMIRESLPIKCLEALVLGIYLTNDIEGMERFPISFKSVFSGCTHHHVVLGIYYAGSFGCLGMSRRDDLMFKPLQYRTLSDLIFEFIQRYSQYYHRVKKIKIGETVSHDPHSQKCIHWKSVILTLPKMHDLDITTELEKYGRIIKSNVRNIRTSSPHKLPRTTLGDHESSSSGALPHTQSPPKQIGKEYSPNRKLKSKRKNKSSYQIRI